MYRIRGFLDQDHFPKLDTVSVNQRIMSSSLSSHLNLWQRHTGVRSVSLDLRTLREPDYAGKMVDVFPAVKEIDLTAEPSRNNLQIISHERVKSILFSDIFLKGDSFPPIVEDLILHGRGFKSVVISGLVGARIVERTQPIFKASGAPVRLVRDGVRK
ncbi:hypothetical protein Fcan01_18951 [Folsomia candida]|uniref:Uncharacterized protein n=1 Tax=Folsomia candida TaxID=158441 RepID=A0A226DND9_FOLCA|nr:hypothetical protein Fcan01_18951 [Folsomia candida]